MSIFEQTSERPGSRFGKLSSNMFFVRNTAKPKRVRHIEGLNGALICNVNDDISSSAQSVRAAPLSFNRNNVSPFGAPRRTERLVPPTGFWNTYGVIHDTERWKQELAALASASGLGIEKDDHKHGHKPPTSTADQQHASRTGAHYSTRTGRFNEGAGKSRGRTGSKHATALSETLFSVPENEREMWMLQVLCQLLGTSHLEDVQSWLVSSTPAEKDQARMMINSALRGLKESDRTSDQSEENVDFNALTNFVERQKGEEKYASQKFVQDSLNRSAPVLPSIDEEQQADISLNGGWDQKENSLVATPHHMTTYRRSYHNFNPRSHSSFDSRSQMRKNDSFDENESKEQQRNYEEEIDTIQLDDDRQQHRSQLSVRGKVETRKSQSSMEQRPPSSHKQKHRIESIEFSDDENNTNNDRNEDNAQHRPKDLISSPSSSSSQRIKLTSNGDDGSKTRKIRELQSKLSRQEEEAKKKFNELQSKQSRLENAIKLLAKQTSSYKKRRQHKPEQVEDLDAPVVNVIIQSPRDVEHRDKSHETVSLGKQLELSPAAGNEKSKISRNDNRPPKVFSGIWKPDASTLHRLQGN